jgi:hypothetical protein
MTWVGEIIRKRFQWNAQDREDACNDHDQAGNDHQQWVVETPTHHGLNHGFCLPYSCWPWTLGEIFWVFSIQALTGSLPQRAAQNPFGQY